MMLLSLHIEAFLIVFVTITILISIVSCRDAMFQVVYTNVKPYIYWDEVTHHEVGIIPDIFEFAELFCHNQFKLFANYDHVFKYTVELKSISEINNLLLSESHYGEGILENVTEPYAFWFPILKIIDYDDYKKIKYHNLTMFHLHDLKEVVVITSEKRIHLIEKVFVGLSHCSSIAILVGIGGVMFALIIWSIERYTKSDFSPSFLRGFGTGSWLAIVTMGTVGYGDITPKSCPGRFVAFFWMIASVICTSVMTATISETVHGTASLELYNQKVTALIDSPEHLMALHDYEAEFIPANNIKDMVDLLENHTAKFGLLNAEVAAYYQDDFYTANHGDDSLEQLVYIYKLPVNIPLEFLVNYDNPTVHKYIDCFKSHFDEIVPSILAKYKKHLKLETLHHISSTKLFMQYPILAYVSYVLLAFVAIGIVHQFYTWSNTSKLRRN